MERESSLHVQAAPELYSVFAMNVPGFVGEMALIFKSSWTALRSSFQPQTLINRATQEGPYGIQSLLPKLARRDSIYRLFDVSRS
jgi:hypothetical protein